jgi:hypothetical protein
MGNPFLLSVFSELGNWLSGRNECGSFLKPHHSPLNVKPFKRGSTVVASGSYRYGCATANRWIVHADKSAPSGPF